MSAYTNGSCCPELGYCEAIVKGLDMVNGVNNTSFKPVPVGVTQALLDPINQIGASYELLEPSGAVRKVRVKRIPRGTIDESSDTISCEVTTTAAYDEECITVGKTAMVSFEVSNAELIQYCGDTLAAVNTGAGTSLFRDFLDKIQAKMNALRLQINSQVIASLAANQGLNITPDSTATQSIGMIGCVNGEKIEAGIQQLNFDMQNNEVYGQYLIAGMGNFNKFNTSVDWGCCNQFGLSWDAMRANAPYRYYQDVQLGGLQADPNFIFAFAPGATQFVYYNNLLPGRDSIDRRHGDAIWGLIPDPYLGGVTYDLLIRETNCDGLTLAPKWTISIFLNFDLAYIPQSAFSVNDRLRTANGYVNGVFGYQVTCV